MSDTLLDCIMEEDIFTKPKIKHIVCSGGGTFGFMLYGLLKQSCIDRFWHVEDIEGMYGTSIGAVIVLLISLLRRNNILTWDLLDTYIISRPWQNVFKMDLYTITQSLQNGGILNKSSIVDIFVPLFKALDISTDMTMAEHYDKFGVELHVYTTQLELMDVHDISYKTHPNMRVLDAVYASCSLPILFSPYMEDAKTYFDGGLFCNYPLHFCLKNVNNTDEIMGIRATSIKSQDGRTDEADVSEDADDTQHKSQSALFDYILAIFKNLTTKIKDYEPDCKILHEFIIPYPDLSIYDIYLAIMHSDKRKQMINDGIVFWNEKTTK